MKTLLLFIPLLSFHLLKAQSDPIPFSPDRELTWKDFQAAPNPNNPNTALTRSGIKYGYSSMISNGQLSLEFEVTAYFDPTESWTKAPESRELLEHEILHFYITELCARKLRAEFAKGPFSIKNYQKEVKALFKENNEYRRAYQQSYDEETDHSRNARAQARWKTKVKRELKALSEYTSTQVNYGP